MAQSPKPTVSALDHLVLTVADIAATCAFYDSVLGMSTQSFDATDGSRRWALSFGQQKINLHQVGNEFEPKAKHATAGSGDLCFLTETPIDHWQDHLAHHAIPIEEGPVQRTGATGPILSLYIRDPDENLIEISTLV